MIDLLASGGKGAMRLRASFLTLLSALLVASLVLTGATKQAHAKKGLGGLAVGLAAGVVIGGALANSQAKARQKQQRARPKPQKQQKKQYSKQRKSTKPSRTVRRKSSTQRRSVASRSAPSIADSQVFKVKSALALMGHLQGGVDGNKDLAYDNGVRAYQTSKRLAATGVLDPTQTQLLLKESGAREQLIALGSPDTPTGGREGSKRIQIALQVLGHYSGPIDGKIGRGSRRAIGAYQASRGLSPTGDVSSRQASRDLITAARSSIDSNLSGINAQFAQISKQQFASLNAQPKQIAPTPAASSLAPAAAAGGATAVLPGYLPTPGVQKASLDAGDTSFKAIEPVRADAKIRRPNDVAVIIGNRDYKGDIPDVAFGHRDADAMKSVLVNELGFAKSNIIDARDAGQAELVSIFGSKSNNRGKVWRMIDPDGKSNVFVFYSGHGAPDTQSKTPYLMPVDSHPDTIQLNGYPLSQMYSNLESLEVSSVAVFLDACFSGGSAGGMLTTAASPVAVTAKMPSVKTTQKLTVLAAAEGDQLASWNEKKGFGMFTNYLVDGLKGEADGNGDATITAGELHSFVHDKVRRSARRQFGRIQTPVLMGQSDYVIRTQ